MASIIKSNTYADFNGREILTANNDGALTTQKINYPAFDAYQSSAQTVSDAVDTLTQFPDEIYDTDGCFNNTGSSTTLNGLTAPAYSFVPNVAGKYLLYGNIGGGAAGVSTLLFVSTQIFKNGSRLNTSVYYNSDENNYAFKKYTPFSIAVDANGTGDYFQIYTTVNITSGTPTISTSNFGAYRLGS